MKRLGSWMLSVCSLLCGLTATQTLRDHWGEKFFITNAPTHRSSLTHYAPPDSVTYFLLLCFLYLPLFLFSPSSAIRKTLVSFLTIPAPWPHFYFLNQLFPHSLSTLLISLSLHFIFYFFPGPSCSPVLSSSVFLIERTARLPCHLLIGSHFNGTISPPPIFLYAFYFFSSVWLLSSLAFLLHPVIVCRSQEI